MLHELRIGAAVVAGALLLVGRPMTTMAAPTPEAAACAQAKEKAAGLKILKTLKCYSKAAKDGLDRNPTVNTTLGDCIADVDADTTQRFDDADAEGGCSTDANIFDLNKDLIGDGLVGSILNQANKGFAVNATTIGYRGINGPSAPEYTNPNAGIVQLVAPGTALSKCAKKQFIALAVLGKKLHFCEKTAIKKNIPHELNHDCTQKAIESYQKKFDKTASEVDCINTADGDTLAGYLFNLANVVIPNIPRYDGCGNGLITNGMSGTAVETCDDGNLENFDSCPSDCAIDACTQTSTPRTATLHIAGPDATNVAALIIDLDYPEGKVWLPGTGFGPASIVDLTGAPSFDSIDFDHALRVLVSSDIALGTTDIAELDFNDCTTGPPTAGEFVPCNVVQAFGAGGEPDFTGTTTCSVTIP
jgi:hypothetical protein